MDSTGSTDTPPEADGVDRVQDQVESLFAPQYQTASSPAHRAIWDRPLPVELFVSQDAEVSGDVRRVMDDSLDVVRRHRRAQTLLDERDKVCDTVLRELADVGYWGLLVDKPYGGSGASFSAFARFLTSMASVDSAVAGLASVHSCIGAVDPVRTFGSPQQKERFLPDLASGRRLSAFALTERCAGTDLTALRTRAELQDGYYVVNGEKLFVTNLVPGRTIGLVCLIDERPAVLVAELPDRENDSFQLRRYGLWALKHTHNHGVLFRDFRVPAENLLVPPKGDGLTIAYHGLNLGRVALCASAAGTMRRMMADMIPWAHFRRTYSAPIADRELIQRRLGLLAGMIVACDALVAWCAGLLDRGYRGEMECIVAKVFGSEAQKHAAIEMLMKTHGGRSFLHGHMFGDKVHELLAPCIYEGEGEILGLAFFKSLVKDHAKDFFGPLGTAAQAAGIEKPNLWNPAHAWAMKGPAMRYAGWRVAQKVRPVSRRGLPEMPARLRRHAQFAVDRLQRMPLELSRLMNRHQSELPERQCQMARLSDQIQNLLTVLCTSLYAARHDDELLRAAADVCCSELTDRIAHRPASDEHFRSVTRLGRSILDGGFQLLAGVEASEIQMPYDDHNGSNP